MKRRLSWAAPEDDRWRCTLDACRFRDDQGPGGDHLRRRRPRLGGGAILSTNDGGQTWTERDTGTTNDWKGITFADANHGWVFGGQNLAATADGGQTWTVSTLPLSYLGLTFADPDHGWAVGFSISATSDGGKTWTTQNAPRSARYPDALLLLSAVAFTDANHGWAAGSWRRPAGGGYGLASVATRDGGRTWIEQDVPGNGGEFYAVAFADAEHGWAAGFNGIVKTTDGGAHWTASEGGGHGSISKMAAADSSHAWALTQGGRILATSDGGATWVSQATGPDDLRAAWFTDANHGWAVDGSLSSETGGLFVTGDGGVTWASTTLPTGTGPLRDVAFADANHGWLLGTDGLLLTADGGRNWTGGSLPKGKSYSSFFAIDASRVWVAGQGVILVSTDGGQNWTAQVADDPATFNRITFSDAQHGWAVGRKFSNRTFVPVLRVTADGGGTWTDAILPSSGFRSLVDESWADAGHGWLLADSNRILATTDGGQTWMTQDPGIGYLSSVRFVDANRGWAVGWGVASTTDGGAHWTAEPWLTTDTLTALFFLNGGERGWAVGRNGAALAYQGPPPSFDDLGGYDWAHEAIVALASQGVIKGVAPGKYAPAGHVTRAQFATLGQRIFQLQEPGKAATFSDVTPAHWAYGSVGAVAPYMPGIGGDEFGPNQNIDRQNVVAVLIRILNSRGRVVLAGADETRTILAGVADAAGIDPERRVYVATGMKYGIMLGVGDGRFDPRGVLTRAQVAVLLNRLKSNFLSTGGN